MFVRDRDLLLVFLDWSACERVVKTVNQTVYVAKSNKKAHDNNVLIELPHM